MHVTGLCLLQGGVERGVPEVTVLQATQHGEQHVQPCIDGQAPPLANTKHLEQHMKQCNHGKGPSVVNTQNAGHAKTLTATPPDLAVDSDDEECDVVVTEVSHVLSSGHTTLLSVHHIL